MGGGVLAAAEQATAELLAPCSLLPAAEPYAAELATAELARAAWHEGAVAEEAVADEAADVSGAAPAGVGTDVTAERGELAAAGGVDEAARPGVDEDDGCPEGAVVEPNGNGRAAVRMRGTRAGRSCRAARCAGVRAS